MNLKNVTLEFGFVVIQIKHLQTITIKEIWFKLLKIHNKFLSVQFSL